MKYLKQSILMILIAGTLVFSFKIKENLSLDESIANERKHKTSKKKMLNKNNQSNVPNQPLDSNHSQNIQNNSNAGDLHHSKHTNENETGFNIVSNSKRSIAKNNSNSRQLLIADPPNDPKALLSVQVFNKGQGLAIGFIIIDKSITGNVDVSNQKKFVVSSIQNDASDANKVVVNREFNNNSSIAFYTEEASKSIFYTTDPEMKKFEKAQIDLNGIKQPVFRLAIDLTKSAEARLMSYANNQEFELKKKTETDNSYSISLKDELIEYRVNQQGSVQQKQVQQAVPYQVEQEQQYEVKSMPTKTIIFCQDVVLLALANNNCHNPYVIRTLRSKTTRKH